MPLVDDNGNPVSQAPPLGGVLLDDDGNPIAPTSAAKVGRGVLVDSNGMPLTHADVHAAFVARTPGDVISKIQERKRNPPATAHGDPNVPKSTSLLDIAGNAYDALGGGTLTTGGDTAGSNPLDLAQGAVDVARGSADYARQAREAKGAAATAGKAVGVVPVVGPMLSAVAQPSVAVAENRPITREENLNAMGSGAALTAMLAPHLVGKAAAARVANVLRAKGVPVPETGPSETMSSEAANDRALSEFEDQQRQDAKLGGLDANETTVAQEKHAAMKFDDPIRYASETGNPLGYRDADGRVVNVYLDEDGNAIMATSGGRRIQIPGIEHLKEMSPPVVTKETAPSLQPASDNVLQMPPRAPAGENVPQHETDLHANLDAGMDPKEALGRYQAAEEKASGFNPESEIKDARSFTGKSLADMTDDELHSEAGRLAGLADRAGKNGDPVKAKAFEDAFDKTAIEANRRAALAPTEPGDPILAERERATNGAYRDHVSPIDEADEAPGQKYPVERFFDKTASPENAAKGQAIYDEFSNWREMMRDKHGDTIPLARYGGERPERTVLHWSDPTDPDFTEGAHARGGEGGPVRQLIQRDIPLDDVVAAPYRGIGKQEEFLVLNRNSPDAADYSVRIPPTPKPPSGGGTPHEDAMRLAPSAADLRKVFGVPDPNVPPEVRAAAVQPTPEPPPLPPVDSKGYGMALRTRYTGEVDVRALEGNQIGGWLKKTLTPEERNALSVMRDEKGQPGSTEALVNGTHPVYQEPGASLSHVQAMSDVADLALHPTDAMLGADKVLDAYFAKTLAEGKAKGVLDSSIESSDYIPHLLQSTDIVEPGRTGSPTSISERTPFANKRTQPTILEAMARGHEPRTIDSATAVQIYAKRHGMAMAAQILEDTLKQSDIGKVATKGTAPAGWKEVGEDSRAFKREVPYHDLSGKLPDGSSHIAVAHQSLYAPPEIADALRPITDPNYMLKIPGWEKMQRFMDYIKSSNVALAFFHLKAILITAFNSHVDGPFGMIRSFLISPDDPAFMAGESMLVQHGMKTSAVGQTAEAYRALEPKAFPTKLDAITNSSTMRGVSAAAEGVSKLTFDVTLRKNKVIDGMAKDAAWIAQHPMATDVELATARRSTARALNASYGGLNWEALGIGRTVHAIMRATMFAPDWTWSNVESVMGMARGGPGGSQARWYMARSIAAGMGATAAMTYFMSGKKPGEVPGTMKDKLFNVYLGKDDDGRDKFVNLFFAGAPNDAVNLAANVVDYGAGAGVGMSAASKANVLPRLGLHLATNKDFMGRDIVPKGAGAVAGTALSIENAGAEVAPIPFGVKNAAQMLTDPKHDYSAAEYGAAVLGGVRPRHVFPANGKVPITETKWVPEPERNSTLDIMMGKPVYKGRKQ